MEQLKYKSKMVDVRTKYEKARDDRYERICKLYEEYSAEMPNMSANRIMWLVSMNVDMTTQGVKQVLIRKGKYQVKSRRNAES